jgi:hypothetical protein
MLGPRKKKNNNNNDGLVNSIYSRTPSVLLADRGFSSQHECFVLRFLGGLNIMFSPRLSSKGE